jgi:hypothetical protein
MPLLFAVWFLVLLGLFGLARLSAAKKGVDRDWQPLARFGHALQAFLQSRGHDKEAWEQVRLLAAELAAQTKVFAQGGSDPFEKIDLLPGAFGEGPAADESRDALEAVRGRILGYESSLQTEMKLLARTIVHPWHWLEAGARGLLLLPYGLALASTTEQRGRRRDLEADPRFRQTSRLLAIVLVGVAGLVIFLSVHGAIRAWVHGLQV